MRQKSLGDFSMKRFFKKLGSVGSAVDAHIDTNYRIGMRVVKTVASITFCLIISLVAGGRISINIAAVSAMVTLRATQGETLRSGFFRLLGTAIGGALGILTTLIGSFLPFYESGLFVVIIPIMLLFDLYLCNLFKMQDSCQISCVVLIMVALPIEKDLRMLNVLIETSFRLLETFIGVGTATVMNIVPYHIVNMMKGQQDS